MRCKPKWTRFVIPKFAEMYLFSPQTAFTALYIQSTNFNSRLKLSNDVQLLYLCAIDNNLMMHIYMKIHITNKTTAITKYVYGYVNRFLMALVCIFITRVDEFK